MIREIKEKFTEFCHKHNLVIFSIPDGNAGAGVEQTVKGIAGFRFIRNRYEKIESAVCGNYDQFYCDVLVPREWVEDAKEATPDMFTGCQDGEEILLVFPIALSGNESTIACFCKCINSGADKVEICYLNNIYAEAAGLVK